MSPSDILIWDLFMVLSGTANRQLTSACLYYSPILPHQKKLTIFTGLSWESTVEMGLYEEIGWRWRFVLQISPKHLHEESKAHTTAWSQHTRCELPMSRRTRHASVSDEVGSTSLSLFDAPLYCHFFFTAEGGQWSQLYVHWMNLNAAHSKITVRIMAQA